jgi:Cu/Ag efflux protein CusF
MNGRTRQSPLVADEPVGRAGGDAAAACRTRGGECRITLRHSALVNLDMSAMTMAFRAQPPELLKAVKVSDAVKFHAGLINGTLTVTAIQAAP